MLVVKLMDGGMECGGSTLRMETETIRRCKVTD